MNPERDVTSVVTSLNLTEIGEAKNLPMRGDRGCLLRRSRACRTAQAEPLAALLKLGVDGALFEHVVHLLRQARAGHFDLRIFPIHPAPTRIANFAHLAAAPPTHS